MKKSLAALAVLGAFAGVASAQTNVTIYGIADVGISRVSQDGSGTTWGLTSGQQSGSRIGFRGTEDLGGGLSAIFVLENGFNLDDGTLAQSTATTTRLFGRQAYVGLKGNFGTLKFGRQETPLHVAQVVVDPFGTNLAGNIQNLFNAYGIRMDNTVNYSVASNGFTGEFAYGFGEEAGSTSTNRQVSASVGYNNGPLAGYVVYHQAKPSAAAGGFGKNETIFVGGTYDFKVVKLHAAFADNEGESAAEVTNLETREYMLGLSAPVGNGTVLASVIHRDDRFDTAVDVNQYAIGYLYPLSKRTNLYTSFAKLDRKPEGAIDRKVFNVGVRHRF